MLYWGPAHLFPRKDALWDTHFRSKPSGANRSRKLFVPIGISGMGVCYLLECADYATNAMHVTCKGCITSKYISCLVMPNIYSRSDLTPIHKRPEADLILPFRQGCHLPPVAGKLLFRCFLLAT